MWLSFTYSSGGTIRATKQYKYFVVSSTLTWVKLTTMAWLPIDDVTQTCSMVATKKCRRLPLSGDFKRRLHWAPM